MPIKKGYILLPRIFYESELSEKPPHFRETWQWLIQKANHKEINIRYRTIQRGQVLTDYNEIIDALKWYVGRRKERYKIHEIETALKYFKKTGMITKMKANRKLILTICKYEYYQDASNYENQNENQNENGMKTARKPDDKQELNNENKETDIYSFSVFSFLFESVENKLNVKAKPESCQKLFNHYSSVDWKTDGGKKIKTQKHLEGIISKTLQNEEKGNNTITGDKKQPRVKISDLNPKLFSNKISD